MRKPQDLFFETVSPLLKSILEQLMKEEIFDAFRLVGGTALSLQLGHRKSYDIDLFSEDEYGSVNFDIIEDYLEGQFSYLDTFNSGPIGFGKSYFIGDSGDHSIKLDLAYTDPFIRPVLERDGIRFAEIDDIIAMKIDPVCFKGKYWELIKLDILDALQ